MNIADTAIVAGIICAASGFGFIIKNFFGNFIDSHKGYRSTTILISAIVFTLFSFLLAFAGFDLDNILGLMEMNMTEESMIKLNNQKMQMENIMLFYIALIVISAAALLITYRKVRKERVEYQNNRPGKWDLDKLKGSQK